MKKYFAGALLSASLVAALPGSALAGVLTFDETPAIPVWDGGVLAQGFSIPALTPTAGAATDVCALMCNSAYSGANALFPFNSREARIVRSSAFDLVGAYFRNDPRSTFGASTFEVFGYDALGVQLYQSVATVTDSWTFVSLNMAGISDFRFNPLNPNVQNMMMDNLTYNEVSSVPEPSSLALIGLSLAGLAFSRRRQG